MECIAFGQLVYPCSFKLSLMLLALHLHTVNNSSLLSYIWQHIVQVWKGEGKLEARRVKKTGCAVSLKHRGVSLAKDKMEQKVAMVAVDSRR